MKFTTAEVVNLETSRPSLFTLLLTRPCQGGTRPVELVWTSCGGEITGTCWKNSHCNLAGTPEQSANPLSERASELPVRRREGGRIVVAASELATFAE